jgi:hypothetical protein
MDYSAIAGVLLCAAATFLIHLERSGQRSPQRARHRLRHFCEFFGGLAAFTGIIYLVFAVGWQGIIYAVATIFVVTAYLRGRLFRVDRSALIIGLLLAVAIAVNASVLMIMLSR